MTESDARPPEGKLPSAQALNNFIDTFYRVLKIGIYYPIGHVVLDQAASRFIQQVKVLTPVLKCIRVEVEEAGLVIEGQLLSLSVPSVKELHVLLKALGIKAIEVDRIIQHNQFLRFARSLLAWRAEKESARSFVEFNVDDLPATVRVEQLKFMVSADAVKIDGSMEDYRQDVEDLCTALSEQGLSDEQVVHCKGLLEKLSKPVKGKKIDISGYPNATWTDVRKMLHKIITNAYSPLEKKFDSGAESDINIISSIFGSLERNIDDKRSKEAIHILVRHLAGGRKKETVETSVKKKRQPFAWKRVEPTAQKEMLPVERLSGFVASNRIPVKILQQITGVDHSEELSIYFQLLNAKPNAKIAETIEKNMLSILVGTLTDREKEVLMSGIKYFVDTGSMQYFRKTMETMVHLLRRSEHLPALDFLIELWTRMPFDMHMHMWPYVVNELLVTGMEENSSSFLEAMEIASHMHIDRMRLMRNQLEEMDACRQFKLASTVFQPSYVYAYNLFAFLLETSLGDRIAPQVVSGLRGDPQDEVAKAIGPLLDLDQEEHRQFLQMYLCQKNFSEPPLSMKMATGKLILTFLQSVEGEAREQEWLPATIAATEQFFTKGILEKLEMIVEEKKLGFVHLWPKNCRAAAAKALQHLKRQNLKALL